MAKDVISQKTNTDMDFSQWQVGPNGKFRAAAQTIPSLHPGVYKIQQDDSGMYLQLQNVISDNIVELPETANVRVLEGMKKFWQSREKYEKYGLVYKRGVLLWGPPGCHARGTEVIMYDGSLKRVEDVIEGDLLMGPDSTPRTVVALCRGRDDMYRIHPVGNVEPFDVNGHHILPFFSHKTGDIVETLVDQYYALSKFKRAQLKLWKQVGLERTYVGIRRIESIGVEDYFGFTLDGDHRYKTKDFLVMVNSGKSVTLNLLMKELISHGGIVLLCTHPDLLEVMLQRVRQMEVERPIIVIMEDIDEIIDKHGEHSILSMLDGENQIANVVYLATTNYPERLGPRIVNRPSRFDERIFVGMPSPVARKAYLKFATKDLEEGILDRWTTDTKNFSIAHLRELVAASFCLEQPYEDVLKRLRSMTEKPKFVDGFRKGNAGFGDDDSDEKPAAND